MKIFKCDLCGKEFDDFDTQENFGIHYSDIGYGSSFDGEDIDVDLCCDCFDNMMRDYVFPKMKPSKGI